VDKVFLREKRHLYSKSVQSCKKGTRLEPLMEYPQLLMMKVINNNPVTTADNKMTEQIFGPDVGALNGKTIRQNLLL
jgi:hypothetical protein